jgi:hypothetical protein
MTSAVRPGAAAVPTGTTVKPRPSCTCAADCAPQPSCPSSSNTLYQPSRVSRRASVVPGGTVARIPCVLSGPARTTACLAVMVSVSAATAALASTKNRVTIRIMPVVGWVIDLLLIGDRRAASLDTLTLMYHIPSFVSLLRVTASRCCCDCSAAPSRAHQTQDWGGAALPLLGLDTHRRTGYGRTHQG